MGRYLHIVGFKNCHASDLAPITLNNLQKIFMLLAAHTRDYEEYCHLKKAWGKVGSPAILFVDDQLMREFQKRFRKLDRTTDILSFPTRELATTEVSKMFYSLGDLVVSIETVRRHAGRYKRPFKMEMLEVLIHGYLHLLGMDHVKGGASARRMRQCQKTLLKALAGAIF